MKKIPRILLALGIFLMPTLAQAMPQVYATGTTIYKPEKCYNGFTMVAGGTPRMVDMNGNLVNDWSASGANGFPAKPLPGGSILTTGKRWKGLVDDGLSLVQLSWDGKVEWEYRNFLEVDNDGSAPAEQKKIWISTQHHDMQAHGTPVYYVPNAPMPKDGKMLVLGHEWYVNKALNDNLLMDDILYEVDRSGKVLWKWRAADHFAEYGFDADAVAAIKRWKPASEKDAKNGFDWWHQNCASYLGPNPYFDKGDTRFHPDNIILDSREANILVIIDHATGKVVWRVGPDFTKEDDAKIKQIVGPHHTHMIPKGLPGEGHVMLFDNGGQAGYGKPNGLSTDGHLTVQRGYSRVVEFDPVTKEIVWEFSVKNRKKPWVLFGYFEYSPFISSAQRLPNGNTLICEGSNGRFIEVTKEGEIVWEYLSPYPGNIPGTTYSYRAYRLPYEWAPEAARLPEVPVTQMDVAKLQVPNDKGQKPIVDRVVKKGETPAATPAAPAVKAGKAAAAAEEEESSANSMPKY